MLIERTDKEILIRLSGDVNAEILQELVDYIRYIELTSKSKTSKKTADKLVADVNKGWWTKSR